MVGHTFSDRPLPLKKGKERRPGDAALLAAIKAGGVGKVLLWSVDRVGRSLSELVTFIETCRDAGCGLYLHEQGIDTETCNGLSLFDAASMMALHVRQGRRERVLRGMAAARGASVQFGRPPLPMAKVEKAKAALAAGRGVRETARIVRISAASVVRLKASLVQA